MNRRNAMVTFAPVNAMIAQNVMKVRKNNVHSTYFVRIYNTYLFHWCVFWKVVKETMNVFLDLPDGFYAIKNHELYMIDPPIAKWERAKHIKIPAFTFQCEQKSESITDEIQHVSYDDAQLGREK